MMRRAIVLATTSLLLFALLAFNARAGAAPATPAPASFRLGPLAPLPGSLPRLAATRSIGPLAPNRTITFSIGLRIQHQSALRWLLHDLYTPGSRAFHRWLTPRQFQTRFAPTAGQRQHVLSWMRAHQLQAAQNCDQLLIMARASVADVEAAFHMRLFLYRLGRRTIFANQSPVRIPSGLIPLIGSVIGLNNIAVPRRLGAPHRPTGDFNNGLMPSELAAIYGFTSLYSAGDTGGGVTIAMPEVTAINQNNIAAFDSTVQLNAPNLQLIPLTIGGQTGGASIDINQEAEAEMDIEVAHGMAPNASLLLYQAPDSSGISDAFCHMVQDNRADVLASSYGLDEKTILSGGAAEIDLDDGFFQQAAAQGETVLAASGDDGAYDVPNFDPNTTPLQVDFPASDPYVTGVGGTTLSQNPDGSVAETAWGDAGQKSGSGGGLSTHFKRPAWQTGPGVDNQYSNGYREVPDVAALAGDPGYYTYTVDDNGNAGAEADGGTSASCPLWAAFIAIVDQAAAHRVGFINPTLYALGASPTPPFNDITRGNNLFYPATPGWDFATGWGSMRGPALLNALAAAPVYKPPTATPTPTPTITPTPTATPTPTPTHTPTPKKKAIKCKKGYKLVKGKCKKVKKKKK